LIVNWKVSMHSSSIEANKNQVQKENKWERGEEVDLELMNGTGSHFCCQFTEVWTLTVSPPPSHPSQTPTHIHSGKVNSFELNPNFKLTFERVKVCVCVCMYMCVCDFIYVCVKEREISVCVRARVYVCVCVREREKEFVYVCERERVLVWVCVSACMCVCLFVCECECMCERESLKES